MSRGEVNFSIMFKDDVGLESSYVMMFEDPLADERTFGGQLSGT